MRVVSNLLTTDNTVFLSLGAYTLTVEQYRIEAQAQVLRHMLCDGEALTTELPPMPCKLVLEGRYLEPDHADLVQWLQTTLESHRTTAFSFHDLQCNAMALRGYTVESHPHDGLLTLKTEWEGKVTRLGAAT